MMSATRFSASVLLVTPWMRSGSASVRRTVWRGLSEAYGSWKTIWTVRAVSSRSRWARSRPSSAMWPCVGGIKPMMASARVDLPQPDSPTRPRHSPGFTSSVTPSTAFSVCTPPASVLPTLKWTARSLRTSSSAMVVAPHETVGRQWRDRRRRGQADVALAQPLLAAPGALAESRQGVHEALCVGVLRRGEDRLGRLRLDDATGVHHGHPLAHVGDQAEIVADH